MSQQPERTSTRTQALWLASFSLYFLLLRVPEFLADWDGEDANGHLSAMLLGWAKPNEMIFSRIDGVSHVNIDFPHPIGPYLLISLIGKLIRTLVPLETLHGQALIVAIKGTVALLQLSVYLALLVLAFHYARSRAPIVWIWLMAAAPVALYSANEIQPDSSTGFFLVALFFIAALIAQSPETSRTTKTLVLLAGGFAAGLGKNEWSFCLGAALLLTALAHPLIRLILSRRPEIEAAAASRDGLSVILAALIGLICGNLASYLLDPPNYTGGWQLLRSMVFRASILSGDTKTWWTYLREKLPYIFFHFVVDASILAQTIRRPQIYSVAGLLAFAFANTLFFSYVISSWGSFPRYFAPAFIGLGICFLIVLIRLPPKRQDSWTVATTFVLVALQSLYYQRASHYWHLWRGNPNVQAWISKYENDPSRCVLVVDYSFVLDRPNVDFVHAPNGRESIDRYLASIGRAACPS